MPMTRIIIAALVAVFLLNPDGSYADFKAGADAYERKDYKTAYEEWFISAKGGDAHAQANIATLLQLGKGVAADNDLAFKWYYRAAEQGNLVSQRVVAQMYAAGQGVKKNGTLAYIWYSIAAASGDEKSQAYIDKWSKPLPEERLKFLNNYAKIFIPKRANFAITCSALNLVFSSSTPLDTAPTAAIMNMQTQLAFDNAYSRLEMKRLGKRITNGEVAARKSEAMYYLSLGIDLDPGRIYSLEMRCNAWRALIAAHLEENIGESQDPIVIDAAFRTFPDVPDVPSKSDPRWNASKNLIDTTFHAWDKLGRITPTIIKKIIQGIIKGTYYPKA
jgi:TPR repeat protein